ncbi:MAG: adenylate/guanylate cyclase domain-containing protein [Pseudomonadota bacterium]
MKKSSKYRLYLWLMVMAGCVLAFVMALYSLKVIRSEEVFIDMIMEENKTFLVDHLLFGHAVMTHMGTKNYAALIEIALKSEFIGYLALLSEDGEILFQSRPLKKLSVQKRYDPAQLKDGKIIKKEKDLFLISYRIKKNRMDEEYTQHHLSMMGNGKDQREPTRLLVALDISTFKNHFRDMVVQTVGVGVAFLLIGLLIIIFLQIIQRYELAHMSIEKLFRIKRLLGHFVPEIAKNIIEKDPGKKGILDKYIQDATILFLDIEGFTKLLQQYSQERINRVLERYFSLFLDVIQKNGGDINETAGDGMMVIFLSPDPAEHARNAINTGLDIHKQCLIESKMKYHDLFPIKVNIGIQSGEVHLGSTKMRGKESERWTFTASGMVSIMAARLSQYATGGQILVGEEAARRIRDHLDMIPLGPIFLKNIKDSGQVYQIRLPQA